MQTGKTTPPAAAALALVGNKPASPSKLSVKQPPVGAAGGLVLAVDGKRTMAARAAVPGRGDFPDGDLQPKPISISSDVINKVAVEISSLLRSLIAPKDSSVADQESFSSEVEALQKTCDTMVEGTSFDEDGAITMLLGVQARITVLLATDKMSPQDSLLATMGQIKASVEEHTKPLASGATGRMRLYDVVKNSSVCSDDEAISSDVINKVAVEISSLLRSLIAPKDSSVADQASFSKEVEALQKTCDAMAEGTSFDEDGAITMLLGVQARITVLLATDKKSPQDSLLSSMGQIKASVEEHTKRTKSLAMIESYDAERKTIYEIVESCPLFDHTPTVCSDDEVKMVLEKTLALLEEFQPVHSKRGMAGLFYKTRSCCRDLLKYVEKNGVNHKTGGAIVLTHAQVIAVLGQHKKFFNYEDAADDTLLSSLRRMEVAMRDYMLAGPSSEEDSD